MRASLIIPTFGQLNETKPIWANFRARAATDMEYVVVENMADGTGEWVNRYVAPAKVVPHGNEGGLIGALNAGYRESSGDVLFYTHNDLYVFEDSFDARILELFKDMPNLGMVGFFGAHGTMNDGGRLHSVGNMLEQEIHGARTTCPFVPVSHLDGLFMAIRRDLLDKTDGFDTRYQYHHYYDRDICMEALRHGFNIAVINISCHHLSGITACRPDYQNWINANYGGEGADGRTHDDNMRLFMDKWRDVMPVYVNDDFSLSRGYPFVDTIRGYQL